LTDILYNILFLYANQQFYIHPVFKYVIRNASWDTTSKAGQ